MSSKEIEKKTKYKDHETKIQRMWKMKTEVIAAHCDRITWYHQKGMEDNIRNISEHVNNK